MDKANSDFLSGLFLGTLVSITIFVVINIIGWVNDNTGFENKLVVKYQNPNKEYDREMVLNMVNNSQVWTNFVVKEINMNKYWIEYKMYNPSGISK